MKDLTLITVIGAGTMGRTIAGWFAQQGIEVEMTDANLESLEKGKSMMDASWDKLAQKGKFKAEEVDQFKKNLKAVAFENLSTSSDLVIEAIIENLEIKHSVFKKLDSLMEEKTIFSSNTSSIPITDLAQAVSDQRKKNFLGLHFFNPATIMKLVEVIKGEETDEQLCRELFNFFQEKGKKPAICKDSPGFIVNRVARNFYGEPLRIVGTSETKRFEEVDKVLREVGGFRMGPFELMDLIGIDINYDVTCSVWQAFNQNERFAPHHIQKEMVEKNFHGRKTKKGFYHYE